MADSWQTWVWSRADKMLTGVKCCRILLVPIVNRQSDAVTVKLFGYPNILYLPSKLTGTLLYQTVDRVVPSLAYYSIHLTDGQVGQLYFNKHTGSCSSSRTHFSIRHKGLSMMMMISVDHWSIDPCPGNCSDPFSGWMASKAPNRAFSFSPSIPICSLFRSHAQH